MWFLDSNFGRLFLFAIVTVAEILLALFLLFYGSSTLKIFAVVLLIIQLFALYRIYFYTSNVFSENDNSPRYA